MTALRCACMPQMEVLPHDKCIVVRDVVSAALPNCRLRLVTDRIGELLR